MPYDPGYTEVKTVAEIPKDCHHAVLEEYSYSTDDGWGNNYTNHALRYLVFKDGEQLRKWVTAAESGVSAYFKPVYKVIQVNPIEVKKTISIELT